MSKDVIIAGAIAVGCIALIAVAFIAPKSKSPSDTEPTKTETTTAPLADNGSLNGPSTGFDPAIPGGNPAFGLPPVNGNGLPPLNPPGGPVTGGPSFSQTPPGPGAAPFSNVPPANPPQFGQLPGPAAQPVEPATPSTTESKTHTVASGEFLGDIAMKYYGSAKAWKKIQDANPGLDPKNLKVGQKLVIPAADTKPAAAAGAVTAGAGERTYTIKSGDTLYVIAKRELGSASRWKEIEKLNNVSTSELKVGQVIKLPASSAATGTTPGGTPTPDNSTAPAGTKTHIVAKSETLGDISKQYYGTTRNWKKIEAANPGVSSDNLKVGQKLIIPEVAGSSVTPDPVAAPATTTGEYTVKTGDTPSTIALAELGSKTRAKDIIDANPGIDPKHLRIGQKLKIPGKKADAAPAPAPQPPASPFGTQPAPAPTPFGAPRSGATPAPAPAPLGAPGAVPPAPAPFPGADNGFNSPYNGNGFGQPAQPFGQTGPSFGQTGTSTLPSSDPFGAPSQGSTFAPPPPTGTSGQGQALR